MSSIRSRFLFFPIVFFLFVCLFAGNYHYMTHWNDMVNGTAVLTVEDVKTSNQGIYSASYVGDSPLNGAWMRLIVRGSLDHNVLARQKKKKKNRCANLKSPKQDLI